MEKEKKTCEEVALQEGELGSARENLNACDSPVGCIALWEENPGEKQTQRKRRKILGPNVI